MAIWSLIGEGILGIVKDAFETRKATAEAKMRLEIAKFESKARIEEARATAVINMAANAQEHTQEWEQIMARNSDKSWKDEYMLLLFSVPLVLSFIPGGKELVTDGFSALEGVPPWYIQIVLAGAAVSYGIRSLTNLPVRLPHFGKNSPLTSKGPGGIS